MIVGHRRLEEQIEADDELTVKLDVGLLLMREEKVAIWLVLGECDGRLRALPRHRSCIVEVLWFPLLPSNQSIKLSNQISQAIHFSFTQ